MTRKKSPTKTVDKTPLSTEDIMKSLKRVGDDIKKIVKLTTDEKLLVAELFASLKTMPQKAFSVAVSPSQLPLG